MPRHRSLSRVAAAWTHCRSRFWTRQDTPGELRRSLCVWRQGCLRHGLTLALDYLAPYPICCRSGRFESQRDRWTGLRQRIQARQEFSVAPTAPLAPSSKIAIGPMQQSDAAMAENTLAARTRLG